MIKSTLKSILNVTGSQCKDLRTGVLRFSGSSPYPGSSVLDELVFFGRPVSRPLQLSTLLVIKVNKFLQI